jgi:hypothetical protein
LRRRCSGKSVSDVFSEIYEHKIWGHTAEGPFCSGGGSSPGLGIPSSEWVNRFISEYQLHKVVDLGCGDFQIGRLLHTSEHVRYIGIDIVPALIDHNQSRFSTPYIQFKCLNIIDDQLPDADMCLVRHVFQHLSNEQISKVLAQCKKYRYLCVTDDIPTGAGVRFNLDKPHGPDTRIYDNSGVSLEYPPFSLPTQTVLEVQETPSTTLRTVLIVNQTP